MPTELPEATEPLSIVEGPVQPTAGEEFSKEQRTDALKQKRERVIEELTEDPSERAVRETGKLQGTDQVPQAFDPGDIYITTGAPGEEDLIAEADEIITFYLRDGKHPIVKFKKTSPGFIDPLRVSLCQRTIGPAWNQYIANYRTLARSQNNAT